MLHELLHSVSVGVTAGNVQQWIGWEEGVVETCQRALRPAALASMEVPRMRAYFENLDANWPYNGYVDVLDAISEYLEADRSAFCLNLLRTPLPERAAYAQKAMEAVGKRYEFLTIARKMTGAR
jgi:hypothetical protein